MSAPGTQVATTNGAAKTPVRVPLNGPLADMDQAYRLAQGFAAADIVPQDLRGKPANVFLIILYGQRLGLPPEIAINSISVVKGRPRMAGQLLLAKVREAGHRPKIEHGDGMCTVTITRGDTGEEHTEEYTLQDAVTAKLITLKDGKPYARSKQGEALPWENHPKRMLQWRAVGACVDVICPEVKMGFALEGEAEDPQPERPTLAEVAANRQQAAEQAESAPVDADEPVDAEVVEEPEQAKTDDDAEAEALREYEDQAMRAEVASIEANHCADMDGDERPAGLWGEQA